MYTTTVSTKETAFSALKVSLTVVKTTMTDMSQALILVTATNICGTAKCNRVEIGIIKLVPGSTVQQIKSRKSWGTAHSAVLILSVIIIFFFTHTHTHTHTHTQIKNRHALSFSMSLRCIYI